MRTVEAAKTCLILLGRAGENDHTRVIFDVSGWLAEYPSATIGLYNRPARQEAAYPVASIQRDGESVVWTVKSCDTAEEGRGQCELVAVDSETIVKSAIFDTAVSPALDGSATPPAPWEEWMAEFIRLKGEAESAAEDAEEAASHYPKIEDGVWYVWDVTGGKYVSTGIEAQGPQGEKGDTGEQGPQGIPGVSPEITVETITGGHRITITDATHPQGITVDVMDGAPGQDGKDGQDGAPGADGYSPTVTVTDITGGHRVSVTDANGTQTFDVLNGTDGQNGTDGTSAYCYIRYSAVEPTQDSDMKTTPDAWMGVYSGTAATAPTTYTSYAWYKIKGENGSTPSAATAAQVKAGTASDAMIAPSVQDASAFYALAKAAGDSTQSASSNPVGVYTEDAKSKISDMLNAPVSVSGSTPSITAKSGVQYVCGECATLTVNVPESGCFDVIFESGSTATVLTVTPPTGKTLSWANDFDPTSLDADTTYEINIAIVGDQCLGVAGAWT